MAKLQGKIALITGGNSGIGLATAKRFVDEGAWVFITGRREPELNAAVKEIGRNVTGVQGDVANLGDLDRLFAQIKRDKGKLDIVFANAGFARFGPLDKITEKDFDATFNTNVKGLLFTVQKGLPMMPDGASIILNASTAASKAVPEFSVYCATKAAVRSLAPKRRNLHVVGTSPNGKASGAHETRVNAGKPREEGCPSCSAWTDHISRGHLTHLYVRGTTFTLGVTPTKAPLHMDFFIERAFPA